MLSCTTAWRKGILTDPETCHVAYVNTPMRFGWRPADYMEAGDVPRLLRPAFRLLMHHFRNWDLSASRRTDYLIANSQNVARRIRKFCMACMDGDYPTGDVTPAVLEAIEDERLAAGAK